MEFRGLLCFGILVCCLGFLVCLDYCVVFVVCLWFVVIVGESYFVWVGDWLVLLGGCVCLGCCC